MSDDIVLLGGPTEDGAGTRVMRLKDETVGLGEVRPLVEGKPIVGEVVKLTPMSETPRVCTVETLHTPPARSGPAQVASEAYRAGWDAVFSREALN